MVVYNALIGHVDVVQIPWLGYTPVWRKYIFPLVIAGGGWDLKRDTH